MLEKLDTLAETSAKAISNIKFDKVVVWDSGGLLWLLLQDAARLSRPSRTGNPPYPAMLTAEMHVKGLPCLSLWLTLLFLLIHVSERFSEV